MFVAAKCLRKCENDPRCSFWKSVVERACNLTFSFFAWRAARRRSVLLSAIAFAWSLLLVASEVSADMIINLSFDELGSTPWVFL